MWQEKYKRQQKYYYKNREKILKKSNFLSSLRRIKKREYDRIYARTKRKLKRKEKRQNDPKYRLDCNISCGIAICLKGEKKWRKWESLVGYSVEDLMAHLEKQFDNKMTWDNYGNYWEVDHVKPKSLFHYETAEDGEFKKCWALDNLQPLEKITNIKKGNHF